MAVFFYDLLRTTRRGRVTLLRAAYGLALLIALGGVFLRWFPGRWSASDLFMPGEPLDRRQLEQFGEQFTAAFLLVQFAAVLLLTPVYTAGAIAEERQNRTFESLLTTHLTGTEIVLGKLASRLLILLGLLLTGLPVMCLTPLWGAVSFGLVAAGFGVSAVTLFSLGALSMYCSTRAKSVRSAAAATYIVVGVFGALTWCLPYVRLANPLFVVAEMFAAMRGQGQGVAWSVLLAAYGVWHLTFFVGFTLAAVLVMRARQEPDETSWSENYARTIARRIEMKTAAARSVLQPLAHGARRHAPLASDADLRRRPSVLRIFPLPPIGRNALLWRELYFAGGSAAGELARVIGAALIGIALTIGLTYGVALLGNLSIRAELSRDVNPLARGLTSALCTTIGVGTLLRAASSVGRERQQRTLEMLLTVPGGHDSVLAAKWLGSVLRGRWLALGLVALWGVSVGVGAMHILAVAWLMIAGASHVVAFASLGLYLSVVTRGSGRAVVYSLLALLILWILPLIASSYWLGLAERSARHYRWLTAWLEEGLVPPLTWWHLSFHELDPLYAQAADERVAGILLGLATYVLAAWLLWCLARWRFARNAV